MFDETQNLDLSRKDLALIEAALHTQQKILSVQSQAGGKRAKQNLTDVKYLIRRIGQYAPKPQTQEPASWAQMARSLFC